MKSNKNMLIILIPQNQVQNLKEIRKNNALGKKTKTYNLKTKSSYNIWLLLRDEILLVRFQEPVDQCLLLWSIYSISVTPVYTMK